MYRYVLPWLMLLLTLPLTGHASDATCRLDRPTRDNMRGVQVYVHVNTTVLSINDSIDLDAGLINNGSGPVYVYGQLRLGLGGGLLVHIKDARGKIVQPNVMSDALFPPPSPDSSISIFVKLDDNSEFVGIHTRIAMKKLVGRPGTYFLQVEYLSPLSCGMLKFFKNRKTFSALPILWSEAGPVYSHWTKLRVIGEKGGKR